MNLKEDWRISNGLFGFKGSEIYLWRICLEI